MSRFFLLALLSALLVLVSGQQQGNYTGTTTSYAIPYAGACQNARGMAVDGSGNMYVACGTNASIIVMDASGNFLRNITQNNGIWSPFGIAFSGTSMYVTSLWTNQVYQITTATGALVTSWSTYLNWPWGVAVDGSGNVWVANYGQGNVVKYSSSGSWIANFSTSNPAMYFPEEIAIDGSGNVFVVDTDNNRVVKFNSAGSVIATYNSTTPSLVEPGGIALDSQGSIYVCDTWNYAVIKLNSAGQQIETLSSPLGDGTVKISAAAGLTVDSSNNVYVVDSISNNRILKFPATLIAASSSSSSSSSTGGSGNGAAQTTVSAISLLVTIVAALAVLLA